MSEPRRLTTRGAQRRAQLLEYATHRFAQTGYHPNSITDIVDGIGVGKGVFYWYFDSKETIFEEILRGAQKQLRTAQQLATAGTKDPIERLAQGVRASVIWSASNPDLVTLFDFAQTDERFSNLVRAGRTVLINDTAAVLREAIKARRIPANDADLLAYAILGVSTQLTMVHFQKQEKSPQTIADVVVQFCLQGIGARQPSSV